VAYKGLVELQEAVGPGRDRQFMPGRRGLFATCLAAARPDDGNARQCAETEHHHGMAD
jgi:hypothetical protein